MICRWPPMAPAVVVVPSEVKEPSEGLKGEGLEELMSKTRAGGANFDNSSTLVMERLKGLEDTDAGLSMLLGSFLNFLDSSGTVRRRLWYRAYFMHIHAVSGAYFLFLGIPWLVFSHWVNAQDTSIPMETSSWFLTSLLVSGLVNALSAIPMSRFRSNKLFDLNDMKANGFTFGGTGLTCMCLYIAWWFGGSYPDALRAFDVPIFFFWTVICVGTTANWELMLQQNLSQTRRSERLVATSSRSRRESASATRKRSSIGLPRGQTLRSSSLCTRFLSADPYGSSGVSPLADAKHADVSLRLGVRIGLRSLHVFGDPA